MVFRKNTQLNVSSLTLSQELFASSEMRFSIHMPLNDKWIQAEERRPGSVYKPEWIVDTMQSDLKKWTLTLKGSKKMPKFRKISMYDKQWSTWTPTAAPPRHEVPFFLTLF